MELKISYKRDNSNDNSAYRPRVKTFVFGQGLSLTQWLEANKNVVFVVAKGYVSREELSMLDAYPIEAKLPFLEEIDFSQCYGNVEYWPVTIVNCPNLEKMVFPKKAKKIYTSFCQIKNLKTIVLPEGLEEMHCDFEETKLSEIKLPKSLLLITPSIFYNAYLPEIELPNKCQIKNIITNDIVNITKIKISKNHEYYSSFKGSIYTKDFKTLIYGVPDENNNLIVADKCETIAKNSCFYRTLNKIVFPKCLKYIEEFAFFMCEGPTEVTLHEEIIYVNKTAFAIQSLKKMYINSPNPPRNSLSNTYFVPTRIDIIVPKKYLNRYKKCTNYFENKIIGI